MTQTSDKPKIKLDLSRLGEELKEAFVRVSIEHYPNGINGDIKLLGVIDIWNNKTGTEDKANYNFRLSKWGDPKDVVVSGDIKGYERKEKSGWVLILEVIKQALCGALYIAGLGKMEEEQK